QIGQQAIGRFVIRGDKGGRAAGDKRGANAGSQKPGVNHWRNREVRSVFVRKRLTSIRSIRLLRREVRANVSKKIRFDLAEQRASEDRTVHSESAFAISERHRRRGNRRSAWL